MKGQVQGSSCPAHGCVKPRAGGLTLTLFWRLKDMWCRWWPPVQRLLLFLLCTGCSKGHSGVTWVVAMYVSYCWLAFPTAWVIIIFALVCVFLKFLIKRWQTKVIHSKTDLGSDLGFLKSYLCSNYLLKKCFSWVLHVDLLLAKNCIACSLSIHMHL